MRNLLDSDGSDTDSEAVGVVFGTESESGEEDRDQASDSWHWQLRWCFDDNPCSSLTWMEKLLTAERM